MTTPYHGEEREPKLTGRVRTGADARQRHNANDRRAYDRVGERVAFLDWSLLDLTADLKGEIDSAAGDDAPEERSNRQGRGELDGRDVCASETRRLVFLCRMRFCA